jgi:hypothetical protein
VKPTNAAENPALWAAERSDAYARWDRGFALSARQAGHILNLKPKGVEGLANRGQLHRRWPGSMHPFHPDDIKAYLDQIAVLLPSEAERREVLTA